MSDELFLDATDDIKCVEFIRNYLPQEQKDRFTDDDLFYFTDLLADYYVESGILDQETDDDGFVEIDTEAIAEVLAQRAKKEKYGDFAPEDLVWVVQGELEYGEQVEE